MSDEMMIIDVPDIEAPTKRLCYAQAPDMSRCTIAAGHRGLHLWELLDKLEDKQTDFKALMEHHLASEASSAARDQALAALVAHWEHIEACSMLVAELRALLVSPSAPNSKDTI